jgi:hypothetical protein
LVVWVGGEAGKPYVPGGVLDEEQDVEASAQVTGLCGR